MEVARYSFSFLSGALYLPESVAVAKLLRVHRDWKMVVHRAADENILRQRKAGSRTRMLREIRYRLHQFSATELGFFCEADSRDQRLLLFVAICQRFRFIREFVEEVLWPKVLSFDPQLYPTDFARFLDRKGADAAEIERLTDKSRAKVRQVLIRMLAEAGLLDSTRSQRLQCPVPSRPLSRLISDSDPKRLRFLLLSEADVGKQST
jgi:hypothetical protein